MKEYKIYLAPATTLITRGTSIRVEENGQTVLLSGNEILAVIPASMLVICTSVEKHEQ